MPQTQSAPGCLAIVGRLLGKTPRSKTGSAYPYALRDKFLTDAELRFYRVLTAVVGNRAVICPQISLLALFDCDDDNIAARNRIDRKRIDFLLCDPQTMRPLVGIELDDSSHQRKDRKQRDALVEQVFAAAQFPLVRIPVQRSYNTASLANLLSSHLNSDHSKVAAQQTTVSATGSLGITHPILCPKCGTPMVIRTAQKGNHKGQQFYACPNYPQCQTIIPLSNEVVNQNQQL